MCYTAASKRVNSPFGLFFEACWRGDRVAREDADQGRHLCCTLCLHRMCRSFAAKNGYRSIMDAFEEWR